MKAMPTDDDAFGPGRVRTDGRKLHPSYLFEVKTPGESHGPWDYYKLLRPRRRSRPSGRKPRATAPSSGFDAGVMATPRGFVVLSAHSDERHAPGDLAHPCRHP